MRRFQGGFRFRTSPGTSYLVATDLTAEKKAKEEKARDAQRTEEAGKGARLICEWLESEGTSFGNPAAEQIIDEARRILYGAELEGTLPKDPPPPPGTPASEIIPRCRPKQDQDGSDIAHYARWLAIWSYYVYPDPVVRDRALNIALRAEIRGDRSALSP